MENSDNAIEKLNDLIEKNYDACQGYKKAAEKASSPALKSFLNDYSQQRDQFVRDLRNEVVQLGGDPEDSGSVSGSAHRTWMDMKAALSSDKDESVLEECITGESAALDEYRDTLNNSQFRASTEAVLRNQHRAVENAYNRVKSLEDTL